MLIPHKLVGFSCRCIVWSRSLSGTMPYGDILCYRFNIVFDARDCVLRACVKWILQRRRKKSSFISFQFIHSNFFLSCCVGMSIKAEWALSGRNSTKCYWLVNQNCPFGFQFGYKKKKNVISLYISVSSSFDGIAHTLSASPDRRTNTQRNSER